MKKQQGFTSYEMVILLVFAVAGISWIWNAAKLVSCDFESNYKCEIVHALGVFVPPLSPITVWFASDE